jgi:hypothetical protein
MIGNRFLNLILMLAFLTANAQHDELYLKANAIRIDNPENLSDSIYTLLSPFQIIMVGEMHGTNESAPFVSGLTNLFTNKGDSVQVGLEINPEFMNRYLQLRTDSSYYQSEFFASPPYLDGRESTAWANLICTLNNNPKVAVFFFDISRNANVVNYRDSVMAMNIKTQFNKHPNWRMITLSGNYHNKISDASTMASFFKRSVSAKVCSLNIEYKERSANASFTHGLEIKQLGVIRPFTIQQKGTTNIYFCIRQNQIMITPEFIIQNILQQQQ